jgi:predicted transposase YbfD/YdcC
LYAEVQATFRYAQEAGFRGITHDTCRTVDGAHGRLETRQYWTITDPACLAYLDPEGAWKGLTPLGMVEAERCVNGRPSDDQRSYLLSADLGAQAFAEAVRGHWEIETCVHWVLDVTFREDDSRVRTEHAAQHFAVLRHIALKLLRREPSKGSITTKRLRAGWDMDYLRKVLSS